MKNKTTLLAFFLFTTLAEAKLPTEVTKLLNRSGTFTAIYNGKINQHDSGSHCTILENEYDEDSIEIESTSYFRPTVNLNGASKSVRQDVTTFVTNESGKRPGGSVCGDFIPVTSYEKSVIVTGKSLSIKQKFRCGLFDRNEIIETCTVH